MESVKIERRSPRGTAPAQPEPLQGTGRVVVHDDVSYVLDAAGRRLKSRRAASCLLAPEAGDVVAWCRGDGDDVWIYAVLERASATPQRLEIDGDAELRVRRGSLRIAADDAVEVRASRLEAITQVLDATFSKARLVGAEITSAITRVFQHAQDRHSVVENMDRQKAGVLDLEGRALVNLHGANVVTSSPGLVKARGGQIHLG